MNMCICTVEIVNAMGLHLRAASSFARHAQRFQAEIRVSFNGRVVNGKSALDLMGLAAEFGTVLDLEARGSDAADAMIALCALVNERFHEIDD
ncbi:MAG: HPr family phosphocarrier protein [Isosphaeraceae bacterium]